MPEVPAPRLSGARARDAGPSRAATLRRSAARALLLATIVVACTAPTARAEPASRAAPTGTADPGAPAAADLSDPPEDSAASAPAPAESLSRDEADDVAATRRLSVARGEGLAVAVRRLRMRWSLGDGLRYEIRRGLDLPGRVGLPVDSVELEGRVGLRLSTDVGGFFPRGEVPDPGTRFEVRRAFLYTTGEFRLLRPVFYKLSAGGIGDRPYWDDLYVGVRDVRWLGTVRVGQFDAPMSLELLSGSSNYQFMEAGSPVQAFASSLKVGIESHSHRRDGRATWTIGLFRDGQRADVGDDTDSPLRLVGRATGLLVDPGEGEGWLVHAGGSASFVLSTGDRVRYRSRPESFLVGYLVDTGDIDTRTAYPVGAELAVTRGPFTAQSEWLGSWVDATDSGALGFGGVYGYAAWRLTGESRPYDSAAGRFSSAPPRRDFRPFEGGWGAWEIAARFSWVDLSDGPVRGGRMVSWSGGLNWIWNRRIRFFLDGQVARAWDGARDGRLGILQARFQLVI